MPRRILHITESLARTGLASQVFALSDRLATDGFEVHVAALDAMDGLRRTAPTASVECTSLGRRSRFDPIALERLRRLIHRLRPDIVHSWNADAAWYACLASLGSKAKRVVGQYRIEPWRSRAAWMIDRRMVTRDARLVSHSTVVARWWARGLGLPLQSVSIVSPGVSAGRTSDVSREELLRDLQLRADSRLIGVIGRLVPEKRVKDLIWAADLLRVLHDNLRLLIIGDGPLRPQLRQYARLASDLEHIQFLGERADVWRILPHLEVLWNSDEGRAPSMAILEAMASGVPVVASDTPINRELIVDGETGFLIPLLERSGRADRARSTDRLFTDAKFAGQLAENAKCRAAEQFGGERMLRAYSKIYTETFS